MYLARVFQLDIKVSYTYLFILHLYLIIAYLCDYTYGHIFIYIKYTCIFKKKIIPYLNMHILSFTCIKSYLLSYVFSKCSCKLVYFIYLLLFFIFVFNLYMFTFICCFVCVMMCVRALCGRPSLMNQMFLFK